MKDWVLSDKLGWVSLKSLKPKQREKVKKEIKKKKQFAKYASWLGAPQGRPYNRSKKFNAQ